MKKKVYLDTTLPSYHFDTRKETDYLIKATKEWFRKEAGNYDIYVSEATLVEAENGRHRKKQEIVTFIRRWKSLPYDPVIEQIVATYIENFVMPADFGGDALHLAYASYYKMDFLLTWNCGHLANANKREHIRIINARLGLYVPAIVTPLELRSLGE